MVRGKDLDVNNVLKYQNEQLRSIEFDASQLDGSIESSEEILRSLGYSLDVDKAKSHAENSNAEWLPQRELVVPDWETLCKDANYNVDSPVQSVTELFTSEELSENRMFINKLNKDYNDIHKLDKVDIAICAAAAIVSATVDILLVGIPGPTPDGVKAGPLSNYIRSYFEKKFPPEDMETLGSRSKYKTPYDAQDNRNTTEYVEGLSSYYHRMLSLGHDPLLGFLVGVLDIMNNSMTTIDKSGKIVSQVMGTYTGRSETSIFKAILRQLRHLKSDLTTSMGLPAPLMGLFNLFQFGKIGEEEQTIAEIVQGMYYDGYDFIQFCSSSLPVMLTETIVRIGWAMKRYREGRTIKECIPCSLNRERNPKLATMLFVAHSASTAINAGKIAFTKNPMAINYPQWLAFAKYSFQQLKWNLYKKPELRHRYVMDRIDSERNDLLSEIDKDFEFYSSKVSVSEEVIVL